MRQESERALPESRSRARTRRWKNSRQSYFLAIISTNSPTADIIIAYIGSSSSQFIFSPCIRWHYVSLKFVCSDFVVIALVTRCCSLFHKSWLFRWLTVCSRQCIITTDLTYNTGNVQCPLCFKWVRMVVGILREMKFTQKDPGNERIRNRLQNSENLSS